MEGSDPFEGSDGGDASPASTGYSSCEGSEFERYCSANSALGTASVCSSLGNHSDFFDAEFGSFKSPALLDDRAIGALRGNFKMGRGTAPSSSAVRDETMIEGWVSDVNSPGERSHFSRPGLDCETGLTSCEPSEGGDSTDYDSDRTGSSNGKSLKYAREAKPDNGNPLLINSSVAFGSDDWDEFERGESGNDFALSWSGRQETENGLLTMLECKKEAEQEGVVREVTMATCQEEIVRESVKSSSVENTLIGVSDLDAQKCLAEVRAMGNSSPAEDLLNVEDFISEEELQCLYGEEVRDLYPLGKSKLILGILSDGKVQPTPVETSRGKGVVETMENDLLPMAGSFRDLGLKAVEGKRRMPDKISEGFVEPEKAEKVVIDDSYDEMVMEMEEILFDSMEPHGSGISHGGQGHRAHTSHHSRDGSSTASTSAMDDRFSQTQSSLTIDWIEVVGAKQKKGDVSFGERLVGVKEYTVYQIRVWSGKNQWEVERRYREFDTLHRRLKDFFTDHGLDLPSPWASVDRESRKIFGNVSPTVISERSTLIQECLQSILHSVFGLPSSLVWFLSPPKTVGDHANSKVLVPRSKQMPASVEKSTSSIHEPTQDVPVLGKTIQLLVDIRPYKSTKQLLETQYYRCAGCHKNLDAGKTLMQEFVHSFGWGKPRLCEYTGQLFCASCHTNDTAVLPAGVLHLWDFSLHPVSQLAKAYLESIYEQPMLCVSAVNPFLFSRVPALQHIMGIRKKIGAMLPYVRCPYRRSIQNGLGSRRYLLENNDFFALKDLVDLSKGAFAGLPIMIENIASTILEHITQQCLVCYDSGIPCSARQACEDPSSLIFPFQEDEVVRCRSCNSVFHELCFGKLGGCPCSKPSSVTARAGPTETVTHGSHEAANGNLDSSISKSNSKSTVGFFSDLFTKSVMQDKIWKPKNRKPVILMGSLPSTSIS
ncbi:hypothetical protein QJS10_CPA03g00360 [Acorus calamus]|uniref:PX domain-containing protein n=1 Tax=Acorus calamus TaxID=4465 RepID=A0AAV9F9D9_ACOCL|nr:hypothetical protein QJS10_CPA03g00360 [Acorus calamus]